MNTLYTIGFTKKSAREFFEKLKSSHIDILIDIRLNNIGQLAGFTKKEDLRYFLGLSGIDYDHWPQFAPTKELRENYHESWDWHKYETAYKKLIQSRGALDKLDISLIRTKKICLLCSEPTADKCHRRIAAEMITQRVEEVQIIHL